MTLKDKNGKEYGVNAEFKSLRELDVRPGDVVRDKHSQLKTTIDKVTEEFVFDRDGNRWRMQWPMWQVVSRASRDDTPKLWRDMTPKEKGALLLAHHEGKAIECLEGDAEYPFWGIDSMPEWIDNYAYRIRPEPKRETVIITGGHECGWGFYSTGGLKKTHRITFDLIDGKPDCGSIRMDELP